MTWKLETQIILNRLRNLALLNDAGDDDEHDPRKGGCESAEKADTKDHREAVNQRLRDLAAFERRAKGD